MGDHEFILVELKIPKRGGVDRDTQRQSGQIPKTKETKRLCAGTITAPGLGLSPQRHTYGSKSVSIVQGLVQDLNVYKTHGE